MKTLINAGVSDYLDFKVVDGCYVYKKGKGCVGAWVVARRDAPPQC